MLEKQDIFLHMLKIFISLWTGSSSFGGLWSSLIFLTYLIIWKLFCFLWVFYLSPHENKLKLMLFCAGISFLTHFTCLPWPGARAGINNRCTYMPPDISWCTVEIFGWKEPTTWVLLSSHCTILISETREAPRNLIRPDTPWKSVASSISTNRL